MWFFNSFAKCLYDLNWLRGQRKDLGKALSYFCLFLFLYVGLISSPILVGMLKSDAILEARKILEQKIPDFTATVKDGQMSVVGLDQPFVYKDIDAKVAIVVNTDSTSTVSYRDYLDNDIKSVLLITRDRGEIYDDSNGQSKSQAWKEFGDWSVNRTQLVNLASKFLSKPMMFVYFLLMFVMMYIMLGFGKLFSIFVGASILWIATKIIKMPWLFKEIFAVGLYAVTLATIIIEALHAFNVGFLFSGTIVFLLWLGAIVMLDKPAPVEEIKQ